jgi:VCBS repeat-containing protein
VYLQDNGGTTLGGVNVSATDSFMIVVTPVSDDPPVAGLPDAGNALGIDGANERVLLSPVADINAAWTAECWFTYPLSSAASGWNTLFRGSNYDHQAIVRRSDMQLGMYDSYTSGNFRGTGFYINTLSAGWHHIAVVGEGAGQKFYIDGKLVGQVDRKSTDNIYSVGNVYSGGQPWSTLDEVRLWSRALSAAEVENGLYGRLDGDESGLMAYYRCDASSGTVLADQTGHGYTGTLTAMTNADWIASTLWEYPPQVVKDDTLTFSAGYDPDGDSIVPGLITGPAHGTVRLDSAAVTVTYVPAAGYSGADTIVYWVRDITGRADTAHQAINVEYINKAPVFIAGNNDTVNEDVGAVTVVAWATGLYTGAVDESTQTLRFTVTSSNSGLFQVQPAVDSVSGDLRYTPAADGFGRSRVYVRLRDNGGTANHGTDTSALESLQIVVTPVNDPPTGADQAYAATEDLALTVAAPGVLTGATDPDNLAGGLFGYWRLDSAGISGTTILDRSGNNRDLTSAGNPALTTGILRQGLTFDGTDDYLSGPLNIPETDYSVAFWFKTTLATTGFFSVNDGLHGIGGNDRHIYLSGGYVRHRLWDNEIITSARSGLNDGQWHQCAVTVQSGVGQRIYVDGVLEASGSKGASDFDWQTSIELGYSSDAAGQQFLNGQMDDVGLWGRVLSGAEIERIYCLGQGLPLLAYYSTAMTDSAAHGAVALNADGSFTYTPAADFNGADTFLFTVNDGDGNLDTAEAIITVDPVNDPPVITSAAYDTATEQQAYRYVVSVTQPVDEAAAAVTILNYPGWGLVSADTLAGTAPLGIHGDTSFLVIVDDGEYADTLLVQLAIKDSTGYVPVTLSSFTAQSIGSGVTLAWTTVSEQNNLGFNVLRASSASGPFTQINGILIPGAGTTTQLHNYGYADTDVTAGTWYYMLEMVDLNGQSSYSGAVAAQVSSTGVGLLAIRSPQGGMALPAVLYTMQGKAVRTIEAVPGVYLMRHEGVWLKVLVTK